MPPVAWRAVLAGAALAMPFAAFGAPFPGVAIGALLAGGLAPATPAYQGALVAVAAILAIALIPDAGPQDTALILLLDAALLGVGVLTAVTGGWLRSRRR